MYTLLFCFMMRKKMQTTLKFLFFCVFVQSSFMFVFFYSQPLLTWLLSLLVVYNHLVQNKTTTTTATANIRDKQVKYSNFLLICFPFFFFLPLYPFHPINAIINNPYRLDTLARTPNLRALLQRRLVLVYFWLCCHLNERFHPIQFKYT